MEEAAEKGWVEAETAKRWAEKLKAGVTIAEDKPKFSILITNRGGLDIVHKTASAERLAQYAEELKGLGLEEGAHFTTKPPKNGKPGALRITAEGVVKLAELSHHAEDAETRQKASEWVNHLLARAGESGGEEAKRRLEKLIEEGAARGVSALTGLRREVEVEGGRHVVEIRRAEAQIDEDGRLYIHVERW